MEEPQFHSDLHKKYVNSLEIQKFDRFEYWATEHLRVSGIYWGFVGMALMDGLKQMDLPKAVDFVLQCQREDGIILNFNFHEAHSFRRFWWEC
jgi:geranylgeranyl transferase type-2 subunit beta